MCPCDSTGSIGGPRSLDGAVSYCYRDEYLDVDEDGNPTEWKKLHGTNQDAVEYVADVAVLRDTKASPGTVSGNNTLTNQRGTFDSGGAAPSVPGEPDGLGPGFHFGGENFLYLDGHADWLMQQDPSSAPRLDWF